MASGLFIQGMEQYPGEAAAATLKPKDLAKLEDFLAELPVANNFQESSRNQRKTATALLESTDYEVYEVLSRLKVAA